MIGPLICGPDNALWEESLGIWRVEYRAIHSLILHSSLRSFVRSLTYWIEWCPEVACAPYRSHDSLIRFAIKLALFLISSVTRTREVNGTKFGSGKSSLHQDFWNCETSLGKSVLDGHPWPVARFLNDWGTVFLSLKACSPSLRPGF